MVKSYNAGEAPCPYDMEFGTDGVRLHVKCRDCQGKADLLDEACFRGVFRSFVCEPHVDFIVLSDFSETEYSGTAIELMEMLSDIWEHLEQLSAQAPLSEKRCDGCVMAPRETFSALSKSLLSGFSEFYGGLDVKCMGASYTGATGLDSDTCLEWPSSTSGAGNQNCNDCSCSCGSYNKAETIANKNCNDGA